MGSFFGNVQIFVGDRDLEAVREQLVAAVRGMLAEQGYEEAKDGDRRVVICDPGSGQWLTVYDSEIELMLEPWEDLTHYFSAIGPTVAINVQDSDVLHLFFVAEGVLRDYYVSAPEYLDIPKERHADYQGQPEAWAEFLDNGVTAQDLAAVFANQALFAEDQLADIADLLGWDTNQCLLGFTCWESEDESPRGIELRFCKR